MSAPARHAPRPIGTTGAAQGYWEYLPAGYGAARPSPLLLFLHGLGENGDGGAELERVLAHGVPRLIAEDRWDDALPFVVLSPQHEGPRCHTAEGIRAVLEHALARYALDRSRLYATGLSCGGTGLWSYLAEDRDRFLAAAIPIAGDGRDAWARAGCALGRVPIWALHGEGDTIVPVAGTRVPIQGLRACEGAIEARMTIYPGAGHDSWTRSYDGSAGHDLYAWLLEHVHA
ncbi:MAG: hypothetical protein IT378_02410 [Sandaracinaceae bacterium]|nr:hypothetical protein [Sandaracinaceae bacterium]